MLSRPGTAAPRTRIVRIHGLDSRGRGVGRDDGTTAFVHGALPGEEVVCRRVKRCRNHDEAVVLEVVVEHIGLARPSRIVCVSGNPESLARDAARLVGSHRDRLTRTGLVDMFPHTDHIESVPEFEACGDDGSAPGDE